MKKILIIAPHPDDEIIGVGGTILKEISHQNQVFVCIVTKGKEPLFANEQVLKVRNETLACHRFLGVKKTFFLDFPAAMLDSINQYEINQKIREVVEEVKPDEVYIPHFGDLHMDHKIVAKSALVVLRPKYSFAPLRILSYETLSETGWDFPGVENDFIPNCFVDISETLDCKLKAMGFYESQLSNFPDARSLTAIEALAKYRGALMNMKAAEAFVILRDIR